MRMVMVMVTGMIRRRLGGDEPLSRDAILLTIYPAVVPTSFCPDLSISIHSRHTYTHILEFTTSLLIVIPSFLSFSLSVSFGVEWSAEIGVDGLFHSF